MKRVINIFLVVLVVGLAPLLAEAQSIPGLSSLTGIGSSCNLSSCIAAPSFLVGYSDDRKGVTFGLAAQGEGSLGLFGVSPYLGNTRAYPVKGVWLGGELPLSLGQCVTASLSGAYFLPSNREMTETQDWLAGGVLLTQGEQKWTTHIEWWNVNGEGIYNLSESFAFLGGFRFDSFRTTFKDQAPPVIGPGTGLTGAQSDLDVFLYLPYVGAMVVRDWGGGKVKTKLIGFPYLPGQTKFATTRNTQFGFGTIFDRFEVSGGFKSGYFFEFSTEYGLRVGGLLASLFAKYDFVHGIANVVLDRTQQSFLGVGGSDRGYALSYNRRLWTVGANLEMAFASPF